jgi:hypothetical protein
MSNKPLQPWLDKSPNNNDLYGVNLNKLTPELDRSMYDNRGKYFDTFKFNQEFDKYIEEQNKIKLKKEKLQFEDLDNIENISIKPYDLTFKEIIVNIQNTWIKILSFNSLNVDDIFYLAISFIVIGLIYIIICFIFS